MAWGERSAGPGRGAWKARKRGVRTGMQVSKGVRGSQAAPTTEGSTQALKQWPITGPGGGEGRRGCELFRQGAGGKQSQSLGWEPGSTEATTVPTLMVLLSFISSLIQ